ncbi:MAG: hypothetical protein BJ554DRAFT_6422 [Olpidium bornovanus]|uniref:Ribosomal protein S12 n=1 Tax=Olpidium bornovanus TaxID=278681 RepID=A0A8H8DKP6_9FUNG|nr:MAG: hypothetical protein BJ554DRAFT_6422 [Olpidium bornovanus]
MRKGRYIWRKQYFMQFKYRKRSAWLEGCAQKKAVVVKLVTQAPKKPNSATRKVAVVRLTTGKEIRAYIPGIGHSLQEHNVVMVRGGGPQDLVAVRYSLCRGALDFAGVVGARTSRSKWGTKKPDDLKREAKPRRKPRWMWGSSTTD